MFELPGMDTVTEVVVNEEAVGPDAQTFDESTMTPKKAAGNGCQ
jgi:ATP-dependent Clp protease ATP-binding subunit ClpX